jgi:hypothetical protein
VQPIPLGTSHTSHTITAFSIYYFDFLLFSLIQLLREKNRSRGLQLSSSSSKISCRSFTDPIPPTHDRRRLFFLQKGFFLHGPSRTRNFIFLLLNTPFSSTSFSSSQISFFFHNLFKFLFLLVHCIYVTADMR